MSPRRDAGRPTHVVVKVECVLCRRRGAPRPSCVSCAGTGLVARDVPIAEFAAALVRSMKGG